MLSFMKYNRNIYEQTSKPSKGKAGGIHHRRVRRTFSGIAKISPQAFGNGPDGFWKDGSITHPIEVGSGNRKQFLSQSRTVGKPSPRKNTDPNVEKIIDRHLDRTGSPIKLETYSKASTFGEHRALARTIPGISSHVSFNTDSLGGSTLLVHQPRGEKPRAIFMDKIHNTQHMYVGIVPKGAAENKRSGHTTRQRNDAWHKRIQIRCNDKPGGIFHPDAPHSEHVAVGLEAIQKMVSERTKIIEKNIKKAAELDAAQKLSKFNPPKK